jgi:4-phosphopantoate--beta-alanine ligase
MKYLRLIRHSIRMVIPKNHPRNKSLMLREKLIEGYKKGLVSDEGLIAHGRGEAFDYLIGERTREPARRATKAAAAALLLAKNPVISVNGNTAALAAESVAELARELNCKIEVNLFYRTEERAGRIGGYLKNAGAKEVLGVSDAYGRIPELFSERRKVSVEGIYLADCVLIPLEDGDRCEALVKMGKTVIAIDLNPLSRTAVKAHITIVDELTRALPLLIEEVRELRLKDEKQLKSILKKYNNKKVLGEMRRLINL